MRWSVMVTESASRAASLGSSHAVVCGCPRTRGVRVRESKRISYGHSASAHISARERSTVADELALRPGHSPQLRMPPSALLVPRGAERGLLVLTAGLVLDVLGVMPPTRWTRLNVIDRAGGSRP